MNISINRHAKPTFAKVGQEKTPVLIMDNFLNALKESLLSDLNSLSFDASPTYYPGIRASLPEEYVVRVASAMMPLIRQMYNIPTGYKMEFFPSYYSLVTAKPSELSLEQSVPHIDGNDDYRFALIHYLNSSAHGGTAFYRHNPTGFERVNQAKEESFWRSFDHYIAQYGKPDIGYIDASTDHFQKIGEVAYQSNRLALYPGNLLHSGSIIPDKDIDSDPNIGRLTANIFVNFIAP
jgi:hypothetical protein